MTGMGVYIRWGKGCMWWGTGIGGQIGVESV